MTKEEIATLYQKRWRIELIYRELKHTLNINNIRSKSFIGVHKEVTAQMIANNLVRYAMQESALKYGKEDKKLAVLYSFKQAYHAMEKVTQIAMSRPDIDIFMLYENMLKDIVTYQVAIRPGRHYPRPKKATRYSKPPDNPNKLPVIVMAGSC